MTQPTGSLSQEAIESANPQTQARVQMAAAKTSQDVASEDASTPNHGARANLANQVARSPMAFTVPFTTMLCAQGITSQSSDGDIQNMVSAVWNTMAGTLP